MKSDTKVLYTLKTKKKEMNGNFRARILRKSGIFRDWLQLCNKSRRKQCKAVRNEETNGKCMPANQLINWYILTDKSRDEV